MPQHLSLVFTPDSPHLPSEIKMAMPTTLMIGVAPFRKIAFKLRHTNAGEATFAFANRVAVLRARGGSGGILFDIQGKMGMGAMLTHLVLVLGLCERHRLQPVIHFTNPLYGRDPQRDWFPDFFEHIDAVATSRRLPRARIRNDLDQVVMGSSTTLTLDEGNAIFNRHIRFKPTVTEEAEAFFQKEFGNLAPLGVHYRGTDKHAEAPAVERAKAIATIKRVLHRGEFTAIFLATDEPLFASELEDAVSGIPVISYQHPDMKPSPGTPIHFSQNDGYLKGLDALINILLLAKCPTVVRTASYLSGWAKVLNPGQQIIMLNEAYDQSRFPDNQIR